MRRAGRFHSPELMERSKMPSKLVRVTLDMAGNHFIVEYGERRAAGLTQAQQEERDQLNEDLIEFSDFTLAEDLEDEERKGLMVKKKRLEELSEMEEMEHIEWYPLEDHLINSLLVVVSPRQIHTYVENIPAYLLDRILDPKGNVTINVGAGAPQPWPEALTKEEREEIAEKHGLEIPEDRGDLKSLSAAELAVIKTIAQDTPNWADLVTVREMPERRLVFVRPNKFLKDLWRPINVALRELYGECWKSEGTGDKDAHWEVPY